MREMSEERLKNWNKRRGIDRERGEHIWGGGRRDCLEMNCWRR